MKKFEWAVIGSGIAGIVAAEILTREGHSTVLIEKNEKLASETTRDFHEWMHTGSLYTLIPDNLKTLKFILGAVDDLLEYYGSYGNMNLLPTEKGLAISQKERPWFENNNIHFKFRIKNRKWTLPWVLGVARAVFLIGKIKEHDWLRRRAGVVDQFKLKKRELYLIIRNLLKHREKFFDCETTDFTMNSRNILNDLICQSVNNGLQISTSNKFVNFEEKEGKILVNCLKKKFEVERLLLCISGDIVKHFDSSVKISYAPLAVVKNIHPDTNSFVELDYFPENCINIITKSDGIGLIGGISFSNINRCDSYIKEVIEKHKEYNPELKVLHTYNGVKSEITFKDQPRNYLYHILKLRQNIWGIIPGKFALGFSIAPEFYRQVYKKNPRKYFNSSNDNKFNSQLISNTVWYDTYHQNK
ncbi:MAG: NAD(P)/FAD-dependent oxidoreductase [Proteobacteria bacterium]|nr:NAD(P)/FAD-dependent oxidoreductase [Pseudomonadota bacterium]